VVTLVEQDGQRVAVASGHAQVDGRLARPEDRFWVGSVTKTFVAVAVMQLVAQHRIRLNDTVHRYLPGRLRYGRKIRIRQLLNHSSGLPDYMLHEPWSSTIFRNPRAVIPAKKLISSVAKLPLEYRPGSQATYSNTNYLVLGEILERVTHRSVASLLQRRIFTPLGLVHTAFERARAPLGQTRCMATTSESCRRRTSRCTGSAARGQTGRSSRTRATWRSSSEPCSAAISSRPRSSLR
jgi:D-alanyl-D-alanine carboxypeptidase